MKDGLALPTEIYILLPVVCACPAYIVGPLRILVTSTGTVDAPRRCFSALELMFMNLCHILPHVLVQNY